MLGRLPEEHNMNRPILPALVLALAPLSAAHAAQVTWTD